VRQLAGRLRLLHGFSPSEPLPAFDVPQLLDTASLDSPLEPTLQALDQVQTLDHIDPVVAMRLKVLIRDLAGSLEQFPTMGNPDHRLVGTLEGSSHLDRIESTIDLSATKAPQLFL
jgi:hypothetical protein